MREHLIILGIDPGTATTGYGVVALRARQQLAALGHGIIQTSAKIPLASRLKQIHDETEQLIETYKPDAVSIEQLFFSRNTSSALAVGQARGVVLLAAAQAGVPVVEYTPSQVKQAVTGEGRAAKQQVAFMVRLLLHMAEQPKPDDAADALAIAICHAHFHEGESRRRGALSQFHEWELRH